jgi:hypothetical protein
MQCCGGLGLLERSPKELELAQLLFVLIQEVPVLLVSQPELRKGDRTGTDKSLQIRKVRNGTVQTEELESFPGTGQVNRVRQLLVLILGQLELNERDLTRVDQYLERIKEHVVRILVEHLQQLFRALEIRNLLHESSIGHDRMPPGAAMKYGPRRLAKKWAFVN